jgi:hypothetical protein
MKRLIILIIPLLMVLTFFQNSYGKTYYRTFEVAEITGEGIVLKDFEGGRFLVEKDPGDLQVGDLVRYDSVRNRLKKSLWQPATVTKMTDRIITIETRGGENVDVNMRSKYLNEFSEGEQVHYNATKGQIKKSNLQPLNEE